MKKIRRKNIKSVLLDEGNPNDAYQLKNNYLKEKI